MENKVYISDNDLNNMIRARKFEHESKWDEARRLRVFLGQYDHVKTIDLIVESNRKGDEYRSLIEGVIEKYENREINNSQLHEILTEAWNKVYQNV